MRFGWYGMGHLVFFDFHRREELTSRNSLLLAIASHKASRAAQFSKQNCPILHSLLRQWDLTCQTIFEYRAFPEADYP